MKKFLNHRVLPFVCALSILVSFMVVPASAHFGGSVDAELPTIDPIAFFDKDLMASEMNRLFGDNSNDRCAFFSEFAYIVNKDNWTETSRDALVELAFYWNSTLGPQYSSTASVDTHRLDDGTEISYVRVTISDSRLGGSRNNWTWCLNDGAGKILVDLPDVEKTIVNRGQWLPVNQTSNTRVEMKPYDEMFNAAKDLGCSLYRMGNYWVIKKTGGIAEYIFCNENGERFVARYDEDMWASDQDRPTDKVTENGDIIEGDLIDNSVNLDLEGMTMLLPGGTLALIDKVIYDESTKSYHIDSHDTYNFTINNYYTWNYYINYTSITYIGQTEEYNKYYEVYYELPDGRSSADLTKEDLEQLNLSIDVIPYGRSADDTSLRSLYHFDGDTKDSSYWNYCTDFTWNKGASLTYMDAGVFDGALYLDETEHDFTITLPSNIGTSDFTLQFRYYQSSTLAPQTDSYLDIGSERVLQFNGSDLLSGSGVSLAVVPVGTWNEIAIIGDSGVFRYYLNGVQLYSASWPYIFSDTLTFHFGSKQQTFKYFDELRLVHMAVVQGGSNYEPTSVPHDTNLTLVLPDSKVPVADEYWSIVNESQTNLLSQYGLDSFWGTQNATNSHFTQSNSSFTVKSGTNFYGLNGIYVNPSGSTVDAMFPNFARYGKYTGLNFDGSGLRLDVSSWPSNLHLNKLAFENPQNVFSFTGYPCVVPGAGLFSCLSYVDGKGGKFILPSGDYTFSIVTSSGDSESVTFTVPKDLAPESYDCNYQLGQALESARMISSASCGGYTFGLMRTFTSRSSGGTWSYTANWLYICPESRDSVPESIVYMELVEGTETALEAEFVESVTAIDKDDLNTPTLAVRTDIDIMSYQIGGVRPSVPRKGMVWAMVENERIASLQVYNGQAWEGVDGRIWTGERWVPYSSYNIITLQDLYDIVDATPNYEYIYSEAGFWSWWQKSWNAFTERLFTLLSAGGGSGGVAITPETAPAVPDDEVTGEKGYNAIELFVVLKDGTWNFITGIVGMAFDGFNGFVESVSSAGNFFTVYDEDSENSIVFIPLEEGETIWD